MENLGHPTSKKRAIKPFCTTKGFQTSQRMSAEQIEELKKNPYFDKYADKIAKLQE